MARFANGVPPITPCGSWQIVHSTLPATSLTAGSLVAAGAANSVSASPPSSTGSMATGWLLERFVVRLSAVLRVPEVAIAPLATFSPEATVPSWQLKHNFEDPAAGVPAPEVYVVLV